MNEILEKSLIKNFSYHDGLIIEIKREEKDYVLTFTDGWEEDRINQIRMVNCLVENKYDLKDREIYQLGDLQFFPGEENQPCYLELYVCYEYPLFEVVKFSSDDFICKTYSDNKWSDQESFRKFFV